MSLGSPWMLVALVLVPCLVVAYWWMLRRRAERAAGSRPRASSRLGVSAFAGAGTSVRALRARSRADWLRARPSHGEPRGAGSGRHGDPRLGRVEQHARRGHRAHAARRREEGRTRVRRAAAADDPHRRRGVRRQRPDRGAADRREGGRRGGDRAAHDRRRDLTRPGSLRLARTIAGKPLTIDESALESESAPLDIGYFGSSAIVLLSDGENTAEPDPADIAEVASTAGVRVHAIGVGTAEGAVIEVEGFNIATALDEEVLKEIASVTDGTYNPLLTPRRWRRSTTRSTSSSRRRRSHVKSRRSSRQPAGFSSPPARSCRSSGSGG